jgi:indolepyruvate ferredoxin oxidoreductase alpha subunit
MLRGEAERSPFNVILGEGRRGVVTSGVAFLYVRDALKDLGLERDVSVLKVGFSYPHPTGLFRTYLEDKEKVLVVEELEPFLEESLKVAAQEAGVAVDIRGKGPEGVPREFELDAVKVKRAVSRFFAVDFRPPELFTIPELPQRPPNLCPGCPHRATYYAVKKTFGEEAVYPTDIGCYTLGLLPPLNMADFLICMGSSVSTAGGFSKVLHQPVVAFIGDSTFFHAGVPGLINAVANDHRFLLVILDNGTTAMTGHQPHPGVELTPAGKVAPKVRIEEVVRGCGVRHVFTVNPLQVKKTRAVLAEIRERLTEPGVVVLIAKSPCPLFERRLTGRKQRVVYAVDASCDLCRRCLEELACPAFVWDEAEGASPCIRIDPKLCAGCSVCAQICPSIKPRRLDQAAQPA